MFHRSNGLTAEEASLEQIRQYAKSQGATEEEAAAIEWGADNSSLEPVTPPVDPVKKQLEKIEALLDMLIKSAQGRQYKLRDGMSKLNDLASSLNKNLGYLDPDTQSYLRNLPEQYRKKQLPACWVIKPL